MVASLAAAFLGGCSHATDSTHSSTLSVVVTTLPQTWLVRQIGDRAVAAQTLTRAGQSPELYQPTDAEIARVAEAAIFFRTGMPVENCRGVQTLFGRPSLHVVDLREGIALRDFEEHHGHGEHEASGVAASAADPLAAKDPHIWLDPLLAKRQAQTIAAALSEAMPENKSLFQRNLASIENRLDEVDREIQAILKPHRGKAFFVFHPAWSYFSSRYGLREIAIETEGKEPSDSQLTELQKTARRENIRVVFVQPQFAGRSAEAVASAIGGRVEVLDDLAAELDSGLVDMAKRLAASFE
jgi:zinc transport system substrate-binding protein